MEKRESRKVQALFEKLCRQPETRFPEIGEKMEAPSKPGVYVIRKRKTVFHVGRIVRAKNGLNQRLKRHLHGHSSFTKKYLKGNGSLLRDGYTYQYLVLENPRLRAFLEAYAIGVLCPKHIGTGENSSTEIE